MFPTICDLLDLPLPERTLDGISLKPLIDGEMRERRRPICFWDYDTSQVAEGGLKPYIAPELQEGTTPLVKKMDGRLTRNFRNVHHPVITEQDFTGSRAILDNRFKLVVHDESGSERITELFDLRDDPAEKNNLIEVKPELAKDLQQQLREWQESVLSSLTGADYK
jgi:arylsulfatase A-like enzyme